MDAKNNPPILFSPRENDNGKTPGGGSKEDTTSWILTESELTDRSEMLTAKINKVIDTWDSADIEGLPHVLTVRIDERVQANTHQRRIVPMFIVGESTGQIGFRGNNALLMKVDSREKLRDIQKNFVDTGKNAIKFLQCWISFLLILIWISAILPHRIKSFHYTIAILVLMSGRLV